AVNEFETATKLEPRIVGPLVNASLAYSNLNQPDRAEACLRRALKVEPNNASALFNLGLLLAETGRTADAVKSLRGALAFYQRESGDLASAVATLRKWLDGHPLDGEAVLELGLTHEKRGDRAAAVLLYRSAVANERIHDDQRAAIARELHRLGASPRP